MSPCCSARRPTSCRGPAKDAIANWLHAEAAGGDRALLWRVGRTSCCRCISITPRAAEPERAKQAIIEMAQGRARRRLRRGEALHAALQSVGPAALPGAGRRPVQGDPRRARLPSSPTRSRPSPKPESSCAPARELAADIIVTATGLEGQLMGGAQIVVDGAADRSRQDA